jgi:hypothetical protein
MLASLKKVGWATIQDVTQTAFPELARTLGTPWYRPSGMVEELRVRDRQDAPAQSLSGIHGRGAFPLHTDFAHHAIPPRYVLLRNACSEPVRPTAVQPLDAILRFEAVPRVLQRRVWAVHGGPFAFYAPVIFGAGSFVRWDAACMCAGSLATDALEVWTNCLALASPIIFEWGAKTVLVIDNWRVLHGRTASAMESDGDRILERIVVS